MLGRIVDYLHDAHVPFHLASYPSEEQQPEVAHRVPRGALLVETQLWMADGHAVLVAFPAKESVDPAAVAAGLGVHSIVSTTNDELPGEFRRAEGPVPPLGQLFGLPIVVDDQVANASILVFRAFSANEFFEIPYDEYARLEQPRLASIASAGELPSGNA